MRKESKNKGLSLIELIIYIGILSVVVVFTASSFNSLMKGRGKSESRSEVNSTIRFGMEKVVRDIKSASSVTTPATIGAIASTLVLTVSADTITYDISGGILRRQVNAGTPEPITASSTAITSLFVTRLENYNPVVGATTTSIRTSLSASYNSNSPEWQYSASATTTTTLR